jgi:formate hydrogenlyase subunit 3/multisubunit Na+/H+ antiporter MnhD subunit
MAQRPDKKELRTFGLSLAGVCLVWAAILAWRGRSAPIPWLLGAAPVLAVLALAVPAALRPVHWFWMPISRGVARAMTWVLLSAVFVLVFTPYGAILVLDRPA